MVFIKEPINMKKINLYKTGALAYITLGILHLSFAVFGSPNNENVAQTLTLMKQTSVQLMGQHNLLQFYTGFSLTMGFLLVAFGLQAYTIKQPTKKGIAVNIFVSAIATALAIIYFHPLAYSFLMFALICFAANYYKQES